MKLYQHQEEILKRFPHKHLLCWDTGTGKTLAGIRLAGSLQYSTLIICPKAIVEKWKRDLEDSLGTAVREQIVDNREIHLKFPNNKVVSILSKERFREKATDLKVRQSVIVDEAHYFFGPKSQLSKSLIKYIKKHNIKYVWLLTATPYMSTPWNIYRAAQILGYEWSYWKFKEKFFYYRPLRPNDPNSRKIPVMKKGIEEEVAGLVDRIGSTVHITECADIPDQVDEVERFKPTEQQDEAINFLKEMEFNPIVRYTKIHQIENGTLKGDEFSESELYSNDKLDRIKEICSEHKKVAVFARYNLQLQQIKEHVNKLGKNVYVIKGDVNNRDEVTQKAEADEECIVLINAACSEGYELPSIGIVVFASLSFSYKDYKQARGRFLRLNKLKKNVYIHLVCKGVDEAVFHSIMKKKDFDIAIYAQQHDTQ